MKQLLLLFILSISLFSNAQCHADDVGASWVMCENETGYFLTHMTVGVNSIGSDGINGANGLPPGMWATYFNNEIIISGTPSLVGTFNYNFPLDCGGDAVGTITVNPTPNIDSQPDVTICSGLSYTIGGISGTNLTGNEAFYSGPGGTGTNYGAGWTFVMDTSFTLYMFDSSGAGCFDEDSLYFQVIPAPTAVVNTQSNQVCPGEDAIFFVSGTPNTMVSGNINGNWFSNFIDNNGELIIVEPTSNYTPGTSIILEISELSNNGNCIYSNIILDTVHVECGISGNVYNDLNENCILENNELGVQGITLQVDPGSYIVQTDIGGNWNLDSLPVGTYTATIDTTNLNWSLTCPVTQSFAVTDPSVFTPGPDFGIINNNPCTSPNVNVYAPFLRRCFSDQLVYVQACNEITATGILNSSYAEVELDPYLTVTSSSIPFTSLGNNVYSFDLGDLYPGQCVNFWINTTISCDAILGETLCMDATLYPIESCALDTIPSNPIPPTFGNDPNLVMPQPCTLPWDNSSLQVDGWCQGDSVQFSITNTGDFGNGDMDCYSPVFLYVNDTLVAIDSVQLQGQQTVYFSYPANGQTWILAAEQHPLHPGNSHPNAHVELCGSDSTQWIPNMVNNLPLDDADPVVDIYCGLVTGSYDPNDKTGYPLGISDQNYIKPNQQLQYVVRFQNTGTDTAFTVVIRDTLDVDLNIFTVTPGVSSHDYTFQMYGPRVLEWTFNNINLPDSTTNEPESNGFVTFTVNQVPNLPEGTLITNEADIYFDFNAPIITNQTEHRISYFTESEPLELTEIITSDNNLTIYPNPNNGLLFIELEDYSSSVDYTILDLNGRRVLSGKLDQQKNAVDLQILNSGVYLIQVEGGNPVRIIKQ